MTDPLYLHHGDADDAEDVAVEERPSGRDQREFDVEFVELRGVERGAGPVAG
ncbi:hypothetical protein [Streptomyces sp. NBC_01180]|uniref:hypothetical protein n=1 Tax=Streptomyces sp. NBC_01180 TaxID=2903763 RepID=UPI0038708E3B|nr:hypothetical protein OG708_33425 [Streptomyces sp. NBC_01180]